jgi:hypothetical protein
MAVQVKGNSGTVGEIEANSRAQRTTVLGPDIGSNGSYRLSAQTGLITGIAAATATAGFIFSFRWTNAAKLALIERIRAQWITVAGFTAAQEVGLDIIQARNFSASSSGGTAVTITGDSMKKRSAHGTTNVGDIRISTTGALTAGTLTLDGNAIAHGGFAELAAGAAVPKGRFETEFDSRRDGVSPLILAQNQGLIVRNLILMGAGGTARVNIEMDWREVDSYAQ